MAVHVSRELLEKHDKPGPRYTSYPTVPVWTKDFGADDYLEALQELAGRPTDELSLDMVIAVIAPGRNVVQIHWGGVTPNYLKPHQVDRALDLFRARFDVAADAEISLEIDPRISSPEEAALLRASGFNRISMGVQDFEDSVQKAIGRKQSRERTMTVFQGCRDAGFEGVNVDLVYGLPGQTYESFKNTLAEIIAIAPDRVACFSYAHVPWVKPNQEKVDTTYMVTGYEKFELFQLTIDMFEKAGYDWIGIDHFAKRDDELAVALRERRLHRNFMGYTTKPAPHMLAFGMSGIGEVCDRFVQNSADLTCNNDLPNDLTVRDYGAPANELLAEGIAAMQPYVDEGFVTIDDERILITDLGRHFARNVSMELDAYLDPNSDKPLFSRTV
jgi:oxygen-independent coproporphyrinogen-3 oxidase